MAAATREPKPEARRKAAAMIAPITSAESKSLSAASMRETVPTPVLPFKRHRHVSPYERLGEELGIKTKTARDNVARPYLQVAITNRVLIEAGQSEKVVELMAVIDASLLTQTPPLVDAINDHNRCDATEDVAQAEFIKNAGDAELEAWIKKLAADLHAGETLLRCLITERDNRRAAR